MLYIVRHGESVINAKGIIRCKNQKSDLTELGREQARKTGVWLKDKGITKMVCSPFDRTQQTAELINETLGLVPIIEDGLREFDCGTELEERHVDNEVTQMFISMFTKWRDGDWDARFENGESLQEIYDRFSDVLGRYTSDEHTLFVTHGGISSSVIPLVVTNPDVLPMPPIVSNTGIIVLEPNESDKYVCNGYNLTQHLD